MTIDGDSRPRRKETDMRSRMNVQFAAASLEGVLLMKTSKSLFGPLVLIFVFSISHAADAAWSYWAGYEPSSGANSTQNCPTGYGLVGLEVKYGSMGVGMMRGACRRFDGNARWTGSVRFTGWTSYSWGDSNTRQDKSTASGYCDKNHAAVAMKAKASGKNTNFFHQLQFACGETAINNQDVYIGQGAGVGRSEIRMLGPTKGDKWAATDCRGGEMAIGFHLKASQVIQAFRFNCGYPKHAN